MGVFFWSFLVQTEKRRRFFCLVSKEKNERTKKRKKKNWMIFPLLLLLLHKKKTEREREREEEGRRVYARCCRRRSFQQHVVVMSTDTTTTADVFLGYVCCLVSAAFFGANYVPVKHLSNLGDGVFFALCMTLGVFAVGIVVQCARSFPKYEAQAMFGGCLWAIGNLMVVPIVKSIGIALGMMIWSGACMLAGWASARFGILGLEKEEVSMPELNTFGVVLALVALYVASKIDGTPTANSSTRTNGTGRRDEEEENNGFLNDDDDDDASATNNNEKHSFAIMLSVISGLLYGVNFNPAEKLRLDRSGKHSDDALDYVFSHFSGVFLATGIAFTLHYFHVVRKSTDRYQDIRQETVFPAVISGVMWGIAQTSWFVANRALSMSISFPIISTLPSVVAALIGYFYFQEMRGQKNLRLLLSSGVMRLVSVVCIANSR